MNKIYLKEKQEKGLTLDDINVGYAFVIKTHYDDAQNQQIEGTLTYGDEIPVYVKLSNPSKKGKYKCIDCLSLNDQQLVDLVYNTQILTVDLRIEVTLQ